ncbi:MAG: helix-turn-helix domain-containing protein [Steroidobacteraceae bacterium]
MSYAELILRTVAVLVLLALAGVLLSSRRKDHTPWLGALTAAAVAAFVFTSGVGAATWLGAWNLPLTALCVAKAALFWLFARGVFAEEFRVRPVHLAAIGATVVYGSWQQLVFIPRATLDLATSWERLAAAGFELWVLALILLTLAEVHRGLTADLVERRRRLRILFVAGVSAFLAAAVLVQAYNLMLESSSPTLLVMANLVLITTAGAAAIWNLVQLRTANWLDPGPVGAKAGKLAPLEQRILASLSGELDKHHVYREEGLTIGTLADRLGTREQVLRRVINRGLGHRNFNDFLHVYRIREACERLRRSEDARLPVLSIALGVGYGSIGPFNRAFKARIGMTPTRFRQGASGSQTPA